MGEYRHDTRCPAHGVQRWAEVDECGPCDYLSGSDRVPPTMGAWLSDGSVH